MSIQRILIIPDAQRIAAPGFYTLATAAAYHADPCATPSLSRSLAQILLERCPKAAWAAHPRLNPAFVADHGTKQSARGSAAHTLLLGRGAAVKVVEADNYTTKKAREERDAWHEAGHTPVTRPVFDQITRMVAAAREFLPAGAFDPQFGYGHAELCVVSHDPTGATARSLIDFYGDTMPGDFVECWDYKTTEGSANPAAAVRWFSRDGYAFQAAFQERCILVTKPELAGRIKFRFLVQEVDQPWLCSILEPDAHAMMLARKMTAAAFGIWNRCIATNRWPAYPAHPVPIAMQPGAEAAWIAREMDDDIGQLINDDPFLNEPFLNHSSTVNHSVLTTMEAG